MPTVTTAPAPWRMPQGSRWEIVPRDMLASGHRVVRRIGGGGAHEVYLVDAGSHGLAAAKLPRPHLAGDPHCLLGLRNEGRALERLAQPTVPRHLDTVLWSSQPYLLLEYVPGPTLDDALATCRPFGPQTVAALGWSLACTLEHIAAAGWVHLDVKPSNIVLHDRPRLLDFELAMPATDAAALSQPTGTWAFMPPEQRAAGAASTPALGPPADVFALAVSLGEALVGRPSRRTAARRSDLPGPIGAVLNEALAPAPSDRPTAAELAAGLAQHAEPYAPLAAAA
jgi:eukaryotic-like serine/threonine-protein kinase